MKKLQVNLFTSSANASENYKLREIATKAALSEFFKITDSNKHKVKLVIHCTESCADIWTNFVENNSDSLLETFLAIVPNDDYIHKVNLAFQTECEYSCKWDDDCFINRYVWDYMIENLDVLSDDVHSVMVPTFSNGIPSVDFFLQDSNSDELRDAAYKIFLEDKVTENIFHCNYGSVNRNIESMQVWDSVSHWKFIDDHYKGKPMGIHPARFSYRYNKLIAEYISNNPELVLSKKELYLEREFHTPYFCNNIFIAKSQFYRDSQKLYFDHWDEAQLNDLSKQRGMTPVIVRNCFGIHMAYGCTTNQREIEKYYRDNFYSKHFQNI